MTPLIPSGTTVLTNFFMYGVPAMLCMIFIYRPIRFGLGIGAILLAGAITVNVTYQSKVLYRHRSFFGILKVTKSSNVHSLIHGTILHGTQYLDKDGNLIRNAEPTTYYHRTGPIGQLFAARKANRENGPVAFIGLGTGSLAYYGAPKQEVVFYEIDAAVKEIAENPAYFTYVDDAKNRAVKLKVVLGDARLSLAKPASDPDGVPDGYYQVIVVDAFSSDAIPVHLITREALQLYFRKLAPGGIVAFHISNRYLDLEPVLSNLAEDADLKGLVQHDSKENYPGKSSSTWVLLARTEADFELFTDNLKEQQDDEQRWYRLEDVDLWNSKKSVRLKAKAGIWTDDFSNILSVLIWKKN